MADPVLHLDRVDTLSMEERLGVVRSMTRKAKVIFKDQTTRPKDYNILTAALNAIGMPTPFSTLAELGYDMLVLVERNPSLADNDPSIVDVILKYEHLLDSGGQGLINPAKGILFGKGRCSIVEKTTNFFYPFGNTKLPKTFVEVGHTFHPGDYNLVGVAALPELPNTVVQGGEISIPYPQDNFRLVGSLTTKNPRSVAYRFIAHINSDTWLDRPEWTWICSEVQWDILDYNQLTYRFEFEFQYNIDTWNPVVVFLDQQTGRPPMNIQYEPGVDADENGVLRLFPNQINGKSQPAGYWQVPALPAVNFDQLFGAVFEGENAPVVN